MKLISMVGARPQFIKAAAISKAILVQNRVNLDHSMVHKILHAGQHYDTNMSQVFFDELEIPREDYNLGLRGASHGAQTEWVETIESGLNTLAGSDKCRIVNSVRHYENFRSVNPKSVYGNGDAAYKICESLRHSFSEMTLNESPVL